ncbi:family 20 glycosylhydrolase [Streptomyces durbertensis]|uniref:Family 20 glycosylhydrolase n=1 Tax=Streptomyces durbertensis TaxID=2448886 RepID=A0ABR6EM81_9ACTN|nr:glycoside hydrolase family 20 protein [Streptomyces durbertensis]MBB1246451.1 family 20 glycosylhydrolase [Streptomyces durbertensis]
MAPKVRNRTVLVVLAVAVTAAVALLVTQLVPRSGTDGPSGPGGRQQPPTPSPTLPRDYEPAEAPRTIPAVREWRAGRGPGWRPTEGGRVVAERGGPLEDEARLLAEELELEYADGDAGPGDVELALRPGTPGGREGYELTTGDNRVHIRGSTETGVFYGTRTLLQSVRDSGGMPEGTVRDHPDRAQRGLMVDIARKHFPADWLADRVREMADLKLNQLHLHFSDDQAFRIESETSPEMVAEQHLTKREVRDLVRLARSRHITVVPEIDSPGHLGAVLEAHPELKLRNAAGQEVPGAIDIGNPASGRLIDRLVREYAPLFPGTYWHLGGDEYRPLTASDPEANHPRLHRIARERFGPDAGVADLATAWLNDRAATVRSLGYTPQVWNDGMHAGGVVEPSRGREVAYWTGKEIGARQPEEYLREGWSLVNFNDEYLYYVLGEPHDFIYPTGERIYREWSPAVLRGSRAVPAETAGPDRIRGARLAVWCDQAGAQTVEEVAEGIRLPLRALAQKVWDPRPPETPWPDFVELARKVG